MYNYGTIILTRIRQNSYQQFKCLSIYYRSCLCALIADFKSLNILIRLVTLFEIGEYKLVQVFSCPRILPSVSDRLPAIP